jgi:superoxide dismutase, Cu-Zn family
MTKSFNIGLLFAAFIAGGCGSSPPPPAESVAAAGTSSASTPVTAPTPTEEAKPADAAPAPIHVAIESRSGSKPTGTATFTQVPDGVKVNIQVSGAAPGKIATHVHETGDCTAPDGKSAGAHFNPEKHNHGLPDANEHHLGDLGNIDIKADGTGSLETVVKGANLKAGDPSSYVGRSIIVHEKKDDGGQPAGNAGGRFGCGVIAAK